MTREPVHPIDPTPGTPALAPPAPAAPPRGEVTPPRPAPGRPTPPGPGKPTPGDLGIDPGALAWRRAGRGPGSLEVATTRAAGEQWVLLRVAGDPDQRVLVYDRNEWECFLDGVAHGEFDDALENGEGSRG